ncbi:MAG: PDZ domain-containing protein [Candidatus Solibacter sp.]|nr:PDZ domain-containing protein [Candidatus Solibacter sp.]
MKTNLGILLVAAASLISSSAVAQQVVIPREHSEQRVVVQKASGGYLGIGGLDISSERAKALNLKEERGVEVSSLAEDGPAAKAGVKDGDVVLEFNGQPVQGTAQFQRLVRETPVGRQVKITVWRGGAAQTLTATVGENKQTTLIAPVDGAWNFSMPNMPAMPKIEIPRFEMSTQNPMLGIVGESLGQDDQLAEFFGVQEGVLVRSVKKGSAAEKAGVKAGDVITKVDDSKVTSSTEITRVLRGLKSKKTFGVTVTRNKREMPLTVTLESTGSTARAALAEVNC